MQPTIGLERQLVRQFALHVAHDAAGISGRRVDVHVANRDVGCASRLRLWCGITAGGNRRELLTRERRAEAWSRSRNTIRCEWQTAKSRKRLTCSWMEFKVHWVLETGPVSTPNQTILTSYLRDI